MVRFGLIALSSLFVGISPSEAWSPRVQPSALTRRKQFSPRSVAKSDESSERPLPEILLYNSKSRSKEVLKPLASNKVSMYTCGPTVYDSAHVGNFRAFLTYDLIKRTLSYFGYDVVHICNLTDVDDKIINRANEEGIEVITDLTLKYEDLFMKDLDALNILRANNYPRATEHIPEMMELILELAEKGLAYETEDGSWYFATSKKEGYGQQLVQLNWEEMETTDRGESDVKQNPQDFCLWKAFKPGTDREDAAWESPKIKKGRPGWHLECSAMARKYLGDTIDIHAGGIDLKFPHHENEIAQSEGATGKTFCNCWLHNGFVNINDEKMSKSLGNFLTLGAACPQPQQIRAYRYLVMSSQYRNALSFTPKAMDAGVSALKRMDKVIAQIKDALDGAEEGSTPRGKNEDSELARNDVPNALNDFEAALLDDLSMPRASAALFTLVKAAENELKRIAKGDDEKLDLVGLEAILQGIQQMDKIFGIFYQVPSDDVVEDETGSSGDATIPDEVLKLVLKRTEAKEAKDWELADSLRARITELGFAVKDVKGGEPIVSRVEQ